MKKYIQSYRLFFGNCQIRSIVSFAAVISGLTVLCGIIGCFPVNEFLSGLAQGISTMLSSLSAVFGLIFMNALYQYLSPVTPGHKYYASLPDGAVHFRRAIAAGNLFGIITGLGLLVLISVAYKLIGINNNFVFFGVTLLLIAAGVCNFTGFIRNNTARIIVMMGVFCGFGFLAGFLTDAGEDEGTTGLDSLFSSVGITVTVGVVSVVVFAAGLIYALTVAEKKWGELR